MVQNQKSIAPAQLVQRQKTGAPLIPQPAQINPGRPQLPAGSPAKNQSSGGSGCSSGKQKQQQNIALALQATQTEALNAAERRASLSKKDVLNRIENKEKFDKQKASLNDDDDEEDPELEFMNE